MVCDMIIIKNVMIISMNIALKIGRVVKAIMGLFLLEFDELTKKFGLRVIFSMSGCLVPETHDQKIFIELQTRLLCSGIGDNEHETVQ